MQSAQKIKRIYYILIFLFWFAIGLPMALSILLAQARGLNLFQIGLLMGFYSLTIVLLEVPTGGLADAVGRKRVSILAYVFMAVASIVILIAFTFQLILLAFILIGVGRALSSGALEAWFVYAMNKVDPDIDLQPAFAKAGTFTLLALGLGTLLGSILPRLFVGLPTDGNAILTPLSTPFLFSLITMLVLIILTVLLVKEDREGATSQWGDGFRRVPGIVRTGVSLIRHNRIILLLLGTSIAAGFALNSLEAFWQPHFAGLLGGDRSNTYIFGILMGGNFLFGMVGNMLATPISSLLNKRYALVSAIFQGVWGAGIIFLGLQSSLFPAALFFWISYMSLGVINSPHTALLNQEIPSAQRSAMLSVASLATYLGAMIGGVALGYIAENFSINLTWFIAGLVLVVSLGLYWRVDFLQSRKSQSVEELEAQPGD